MFFLSNRTCRTGLSRFGKLTFPKSADSQFLKTADCDYSEICRNKVTAYTFLFWNWLIKRSLANGRSLMAGSIVSKTKNWLAISRSIL